MARPAFMPNLKKAEEPVVVATATPVVDEAPVVTETTPGAPETVVEKKPRKKSTEDRKKPNKPMTPEDTKFIIDNVKNMSYTEIAEARGITKHQVNRVLMQVKKQLREAAGDNKEALTAVENHIKEHLSRPEDSLPGGGARASVVKNSIDDIVAGILTNLS
jgi:beta-N-acetylglucosaminidase